MNTNLFKDFISNYVFLPESDWMEISKYLHSKDITKGDFLLKEGEICNHFYFLERGLLRFSILRNGEYVSKFFTIPPYAFTSQHSFSNRLHAKENIEVLESGLVWQISYGDTHGLLHLKSWNTFIRKLIQEVQFFTEQILEEAQNETAEKRYLNLLETKPNLVKRVSLKHLASFLGITPQSLSRIRNKIEKLS